jgi:predicted  nucleic acid-binding Zn-ribbon protein|nr:MAG TPA: resistance protein [Caudoviricetes sp.]
MTLYEIDEEIQELLSEVDPETGELITDYAALDALLMEREAKIENIVLFIKNLSSDVRELKAEEAALAERRKKAEKKAERLREYVSHALGGERFQTPRCCVSFRKSTALELGEGFTEWAKEHADTLLRYKEPEPDKTAIKAALAGGAEIPNAKLVQNTTMTIK